MQSIAQKQLLLEAESKLIVLKSYYKGDAAKAESVFQARIYGFLIKWYAYLDEVLKRNNVYTRASRQAATLLKIPTVEATTLAEEYSKDLLSPVVDIFLNSPQRKELETILYEYSLKQYYLGAKTALNSLGFSVRKESEAIKEASSPVVFNLEDARIIAFLQERAIKYGSGIVAETIQDARKIIRDTILLKNGSVDEASEEIAAKSSIPEWRALKIARTETQAAFNTAMFDTYSKSGVKRKKWISVGDSRVRRQHVQNESAGWIDINLAFPSGQLHPGDGVLSINCRCSMMADLADPSLNIVPWDGKSSIP